MLEPPSNPHAAHLHRNSVSVRRTIDLCVIKNIFLPVSGDILPVVLYTIERGIDQLMFSEHPNEAKSMPIGAGLVIAIN